MDLSKIAIENCIYKHHCGSHLYGTNTPTSDIDIGGVFIPPIDYFFGLLSCEQVDSSIKNKDESNKNTKDAVDEVYFTLKKFVQLASDNNPNIIERLFVDEKNILIKSEIIEDFIKNYNWFVSKRIIGRFCGYASAQKHKMVIRTDKFNELIAFRDYIKKFDDHDILVEIKRDSDSDLFGKFHEDILVVGDLSLQKTCSFKKVKNILDERIAKGSNRKDIILKYGFDTKFASHLIRLLTECIELLETGKLVFPLSNKDLLLDIKYGKYDIVQVLDMANELESKVRTMNSKIREVPDMNSINNCLVKNIHRFFKFKE